MLKTPTILVHDADQLYGSNSSGVSFLNITLQGFVVILINTLTIVVYDKEEKGKRIKWVGCSD